MSFVWIAVFSHLLFAINAVIDKFLLHEKRIGHPETYAFAIGIFSLVVVVLIPFGFSVPEAAVVMLALLAGALFTFSLFGLFAALKYGEASRVVPVVGGFVAFFTLLFAYFLVGERLLPKDLWAFALLVAGGVLMANRGLSRQKVRFGLDAFLLMIFTGLLFGLSLTLTKQVFSETGFINGLIWTRFGMAFGSVTMLLNKQARRAIGESFSMRRRRQNAPLFVTGQAVGALASFAQNYAIALGSVSIVNALQGTQFAFLFILTLTLSKWFPKILQEEVTRKVVTRKVIAIGLISAGIMILAL